MVRVVVFLSIFAMAGIAKNRQWRTGTVLDATAARETYVIESSGERYAATRVLHNSDKPSRIANMRDVKFVVEKGKIFVLDDEGRTHEFPRIR
jgi:hypothetical protein